MEVDLRFIPFFIISILFVACGGSTEVQVRQAIDRAQSHLSFDRCDEAIAVLEKVGPQERNGLYLQVLASAYACRAGYSEIDFIVSDIANIQSSGQDLMKSLSILSLSPEDSADSAAYLSLKRAINLLIGGTPTPGHLERVSSYGPRKAGDMSIQLLLMSIVQLGKFLHYYGNVDGAGTKGAGGGVSRCFLTYTDPAALTVLQQNPHATGACVFPPVGHPDLALAPAASLTITKRRLCEGLILISNVLDILENLDLSANAALGSLSGVAAGISSYKAAAVAAGLGDLMATTSESSCRSMIESSAGFNDMQRLYALVFETGLQ